MVGHLLECPTMSAFVCPKETGKAAETSPEPREVRPQVTVLSFSVVFAVEIRLSAADFALVRRFEKEKCVHESVVLCAATLLSGKSAFGADMPNFST